MTSDGFWTRKIGFAVLLSIPLLLGAMVFAYAEKQKPAAAESIEEGKDILEPSMVSSYDFTLVAVGDIMLDRGVGRKIRDLGAGFPFERVAEVLREADLTFGNLESPVSSLGRAVKGKEITFRAAPKSISGIMSAGIDVLSLANNHAMDYGSAALMETMDILAHNGVAYIGAGINSTAAHRPANLVFRRINVSLLAYSYSFHMAVEAQPGRPGIAIAHSDEIKADIEKAKAWADIVIVSFHWGWEYSDHPDAETRELAHLAVESGADLVVGHHPHVIQGVEVYKDGLICYSLGNFIFDQRGKRTTRGLALQCAIGRSGIKQAKLLPIVINPAEFRPSLALGAAAQSILLELRRLSGQLGTEMRLKENAAIVKYMELQIDTDKHRQISKGGDAGWSLKRY